VDRDFLYLLVLIGIATVLFFFTRNVAARQRQIETQTAAVWYARGQSQMDSGSVEPAIDSFRKAVASDRENRPYTFALANALAAGNHNQEAEQTVLRLRELDPEDAKVNLVLAGLAAKSGNLQETVRYYENAIYGRWTGAEIDERRRAARTELIEFLLAHKQRDRALSELLILDSDLPETAAAHTRAGSLFLQAGDSAHALKNFRVALRLNPRDAEALYGAGKASFQIGDYVKARHYLQASLVEHRDLAQAQQLLSLVNTVLSWDPLAPHLGLGMRQQRLAADFDQAVRRLQTCASQTSPSNNNSSLQDLAQEASTMKPNLQMQRIRRDPDLVRSALDLIYRMETATSTACGEATGMDKALLLIAGMHNGKE
jgi:tetratricopeptide (TPR) repeat protein